MVSYGKPQSRNPSNNMFNFKLVWRGNCGNLFSFLKPTRVNTETYPSLRRRRKTTSKQVKVPVLEFKLWGFLTLLDCNVHLLSCDDIELCVVLMYEAYIQNARVLGVQTQPTFWDFPSNFRLTTRNLLSLHCILRQHCQLSPNHVQYLLKSYINTHKYHIV